MSLPLRSPWQLDASVSLAYERYLHHNLIDALTDNGTGTTDPDQRRDRVGDARLALSRELTPYLRAELAWRYVRRDSNVDAYTLDRHVVGLYFRCEI